MYRIKESEAQKYARLFYEEIMKNSESSVEAKTNAAEKLITIGNNRQLESMRSRMSAMQSKLQSTGHELNEAKLRIRNLMNRIAELESAAVPEPSIPNSLAELYK